MVLEELEALATIVEEEHETHRAKLLRMIRAYVRILAAREPELFKAWATVYADEDGHWDNSYPPRQEWKQKTSPASIRVRELDFDSIATSEGFYHESKYFTTVPGLYVDSFGEFISSELTGTGRFGQFAAHPGDCGVDCEIDYSEIRDEDVPTSVLTKAEERLRGLAFPASVSQ